jgi:hypothetical protein
MSSLDTNQTALALACVVDALASAIDPTGASLRRARRHLNDGLLLAEQMDAANSPVAEIVRGLLANLEHVRRFPILCGIPESGEQ